MTTLPELRTSPTTPEGPDSITDSDRWWRGTRLRGLAEIASLLAAVSVFAFIVTPRAGGTQPGTLRWGLAALVPALVLTRPWSHVPRREAGLALAVLLGTVAVPLLTAAGWSDGLTPATWAYAVGWFLVTRAYVRTPNRRLLAGTVVLLLGLDQFCRPWIAWWGGEDPSLPMIGTFYWHNPFAAFELGTGLVAAAAAVMAPRGRLIGLLVAPICFAGVVLSTSRASLAIAALGLVALLGLAVTAGPPLRALARWGGVVALTFGFLVFITGPVFFARSSGPVDGISRRSEAESLSSNGSSRLVWWGAAVDVFAADPVAGSGFGEFRHEAKKHVPPGTFIAASVHNGYLQAFAEGGLVHGLPVAVAAVALAVGVLRATWRALRDHSTELWITGGAAVAALALGVHAGVDFDWNYPSLLALLAVLSAVALGSPVQVAADSSDGDSTPAMPRRTG